MSAASLHLAADELIHRHARLAAFDVPQRVADAADGAVLNRVVLVVRTHVTELPDLLDSVRGSAHHQWLQVLLDCCANEFGAASGKRGCGATVAVESCLIGRDLYDRRVIGAAAPDLNHADVFDTRRRHSARGAIHGCLRVLFSWRGAGVSNWAPEKAGYRRAATQQCCLQHCAAILHAHRRRVLRSHRQTWDSS